MSDENKPNEEPLVGWEEIAKHLGVSSLHARNLLARLPVDPLVVHKRGHYVYAYPSELDAWRKRSKPGVAVVSIKINPETGRPLKVARLDGIDDTIDGHAKRLGVTYGAVNMRLLRAGRPSTRGKKNKKDPPEERKDAES